MDFIDGQDLQEILEQRGQPLPEDNALPWIGQICDALYYLHSQNPPIIHRDIKPANIKITPSGRAMLVDFGIAKVYDPSLKTTIGAQAVTPGYSPQEQYGKGITDARTDLYALGATFYTLLTGQEPPESIQRNLGAPLAAPRTLNRSISIPVERAILKAMEMLPDQRFQNALEFKTAMTALPALPRPIKAQPAPLAQATPPAVPVRRQSVWLGGGIAAALLLVILVGLLWRGKRSADDDQHIITASVQAGQGILSTTVPSVVTVATVSPEALTTASPSIAPLVITQTSGVDGMIMVSVPAGVFAMGSSDSDPQAADDEKPQHTVYLEAYWMDQTEVTNRMYAVCVQAGMCRSPGQSSSKTRLFYYGESRYDDYPVLYVSWEDAKAYCQWAGRRLPTEAEWEKAARGDGGRLFPWGDTPPTPGLLNYDNQVGDTTQAGSYPLGASPYGALDMAGNVSEWTADWYDERYYAVSPALNPIGPLSGTYRVLRGGSWFSSGRAVRAAFRLWNLPDLRSDGIGFRCAY
jgi:formylglycine-generating enzyme required for sulfatase activity